MSSAQDMRCPRTSKMFARYVSAVQLVEVSCQECRRPLRTSNPDLAHVLHRYSAADGSFVDTPAVGLRQPHPTGRCSVIQFLGEKFQPPFTPPRPPQATCKRGHRLVPVNLVASDLPASTCRSCSAGRAARTYARRTGKPAVDVQAVADRFSKQLLLESS